MTEKYNTEKHLRFRRREAFHWIFYLLLLVETVFIIFFSIFPEYLLSKILLKPENKPMDIINNIVAPLIVAIIIGAITGVFGWLLANRRIQRKLDAAPRKYVEELDQLIKNAIAEGPTKADVNARAIVSARNSLRKSLISISGNLNSEIDRLASEIGEEVIHQPAPSTRTPAYSEISKDRAFQTIEVLSKVWPAKKTQIVVEIRKLLAELDLGSKDFNV